MAERNQRKVRVGTVISDKMNKTVIVRVERQYMHRKYGRIIHTSSKFAAHDEKREAKEGDVVRIVETRPLSKTKRWRLVDIVTKAA
jgi:small subunit ribosomal protein S17